MTVDGISCFFFIKKPSKPDYTDPSAYGSICKSSHVGQVFERILNNRLKIFLMNNNLMDYEQESFLPKKSTTCSLFLFKLEYDILASVPSLNILDLEKAFESVWHNGLLLKLWTAGIRGRLFELLSKFLTCHVVKIRLDDMIRQLFKPKQGILQRNVLSPQLFYIADMVNKTTGIKFKMLMTHKHSR